MNIAAWLLAVVVAAVAGSAGGYWRGDVDGNARAVAKQDAKSVTDLRNLIDSHKNLIDAAGQASRGMRLAVARRQSADAQSTKEIQDALSQTAGDRAGCLFPADSMRQLAEARARAAEAAAGGIRGALPSTGTSTIRP